MRTIVSNLLVEAFLIRGTDVQYAVWHPFAHLLYLFSRKGHFKCPRKLALQNSQLRSQRYACKPDLQ